MKKPSLSRLLSPTPVGTQLRNMLNSTTAAQTIYTTKTDTTLILNYSLTAPSSRKSTDPFSVLLISVDQPNKLYFKYSYSPQPSVAVIQANEYQPLGLRPMEIAYHCKETQSPSPSPRIIILFNHAAFLVATSEAVTAKVKWLVIIGASPRKSTTKQSRRHRSTIRKGPRNADQLINLASS